MEYFPPSCACCGHLSTASMALNKITTESLCALHRFFYLFIYLFFCIFYYLSFCLSSFLSRGVTWCNALGCSCMFLRNLTPFVVALLLLRVIISAWPQSDKKTHNRQRRRWETYFFSVPFFFFLVLFFFAAAADACYRCVLCCWLWFPLYMLFFRWGQQKALGCCPCHFHTTLILDQLRRTTAWAAVCAPTHFQVCSQSPVFTLLVERKLFILFLVVVLGSCTGKMTVFRMTRLWLLWYWKAVIIQPHWCHIVFNHTWRKHCFTGSGHMDKTLSSWSTICFTPAE